MHMHVCVCVHILTHVMGSWEKETERHTERHREKTFQGKHPNVQFTNVQFSESMCPSRPIWTSPSQLTGKDLEESGDVKAAAFGEGEELAEEQEQRQDAEDDRQDHGGLDRLQPFWRKKHPVRQAWEWPGRTCHRACGDKGA